MSVADGLAILVGMRPPKSAKIGAKDTAILVKMSTKEKALLKERADALGKPLSTYLREAGLV